MPPGEDPRNYARTLAAVYDATMAGDRSPARPRDVIRKSWQRLRELGVDPEQSRVEPSMDVAELDLRRRESGLYDVLDDVTRGLESVTASGENIMVVADIRGTVLWRSGSNRVLDQAGRLGFIEGANWAEDSVGTNAIGTALVSHQAVQIFSAEHYARSHHPWTCAGAPIRDPRDDRVIGVVDISGPAKTIHPTTLALVDAVARLAQSHLRDKHRDNLDQLRSVAAPMLARGGSPALVTDAHGWVAAVDSLPHRTRILLPAALTPGRTWFPALGLCELDPLPGGWLIRPTSVGSNGAAPTVHVDLRDSENMSVTVSSELGEWTYSPTQRHAEILFLLGSERRGRTASQLAQDLFDDPARTVTVRAEMSRLRKNLAGVVAAQPYRFVDAAQVMLSCPDIGAHLLPFSSAPAVRAARIRE
ncbi:GAF domain-containing protein [Rhodococcus sp. NPDC056743]|uniref:GAF domain-containing protein n=1 Tax=Rhodococcus sp. NPDC056743 TaxID=3345934 RepID=UPI00367196CE